MRASDVNIIPANYLRQENILTIISSFFHDIHNNREPIAKPSPWQHFRFDRFCQALRNPTLRNSQPQNQDRATSRERISVSSQVDISANWSGGLMLKTFLRSPEKFLLRIQKYFSIVMFISNRSVPIFPVAALRSGGHEEASQSEERWLRVCL
jgi:hypothetical protein